MSDISIVRHQSIIDPNKHLKTQIHIIGVGATGSRVFMALVELGFTNIRCYDPDHIEPHNLANQAFLSHQVGENKVDACKELYKLKTGSTAPDSMVFDPVRLPHDQVKLSGIVFLLTDSMSSRKEIAQQCLKDNPYIELVIETRMASSYGNVFTFNPYMEDEYNKWHVTLSTDETTELSPCGTSISVGPTANIIANLAVWQMICYLTEKESLETQINIFLKPMIVGVQ